MREIGSEFWDVPVIDKQNNIFPKNTQWFLSGRSALKAIIKEIGPQKRVVLPSWCCDSIIKPFVDEHYDIEFYPFSVNGKIDQETIKNSDVLFLMDFFGHVGEPSDLGDYKGIIIRDVTHSVFSITYSDADFYFGSLRKWCGVWTGGFAWTKDGHGLVPGEPCSMRYIYLREKAMQLKEKYILKQGATDKKYLKVFEEAEECLEDIGIVQAAERDILIAQKLDDKGIIRQRRINAEVLCQAFVDWLIFPQMKPNECPMFVPILVPNGRRDELRRHLIRNEIYCPVHWPLSRYHRVDSETEYIYQNELSLVCDQRYSVEDMRRVVKAIKTFLEE